MTMNVLRHTTYIVALMTILLLVLTLPGEKGLIRGYQLYQELVDLKNQNTSLEKGNCLLTQEAMMLKENRAYIEHIIIKEMNLVHPGDKIVVFKKKKK